MAAFDLEILFQSTESCSLGRVTLCARLIDGLGVLSTGPFRLFPGYGLSLITRGQGLYRDAEGREVRLAAGHVVLVTPDLAHRYNPSTGTTWDELYLVFDGPAFDALRPEIARQTRRCVPLPDPSKFASSIEAATRPGLTSLQRVCAVQSILADLLAQSPSEAVGESRPTWLVTAMAMLNTHGPQEVAERLAMNAETFRKRFRQEAGLTPTAFRESSRVRAATDLLRYTSLPQKAIAARLGYPNEYYFSRRFRQATGVAPGRYRALSQGPEAPPT